MIDPWGRATLLSTPTQPLNLRLPGQWYAAESSLHQNWMREYDPALGRYIEADPLSVDAGSNPYAYVQSNPLNAIDPEGLQAQIIRRWIGSLLAPLIGPNSGPVTNPMAPPNRQPAVPYTMDPSYDEQCSECEEQTPRSVAEADAYLYAGIYPSDPWITPLGWDQYGTNQAERKTRAVNEFKRAYGSPNFGYRGPYGEEVTEHPVGHPRDASQPWHKCPHFHARNRFGSSKVFPYRPGSN